MEMREEAKIVCGFVICITLGFITLLTFRL